MITMTSLVKYKISNISKPLFKKAVHRLCTLECHPNMLLQDAVDQTANQPISAIFQLYHDDPF